MTRLHNAPIVSDEDGPVECQVESCDGTYRQYDYEHICDECGHVRNSDFHTDTSDPWERFDNKRDEYSGFTGEDRVKMVGGFVGAY